MAQEYVIKLKIDDKEFEGKLQVASNEIDNVNEHAESVSSTLSEWGNIVTGLNQALELAGKLWSVISKPIGVAGEFEQYEVQFEVLLGGIAEARERINELSEFAAKTPFEFPEIIRASRQLEVMTNGAISTGEGLRLLGDTAAGVGVPIDELAMWFGRLYDSIQSGRPAGEAMMRLQELGAMSGETRGEIERLMSQNADAAEVWDYFTESMGRFDGMMQRQSETYEGMVSNLDDSITLLNRAIGMVLLPMAKEIVDFIIPAVEMLEKLFKSAAENALEAYKDQKTYVEQLEAALPGLLQEYDTLKEKTELNKDEQVKLKTVVNDIAELLPTAVTQWDEYGNAMDIVRGKIEDVIEMERARLQFMHKETIEELEKEVENFEKKRKTFQDVLNQGYETIRDKDVGGGRSNIAAGLIGSTEQRNLTAERIAEIREEMQQLTFDIKGANAQLAKLRGDDLILPEPGKEDGGSGGGNDPLKAIQNELKFNQLQKELNEISLKDYRDYLIARIETLASSTAEEKALKLKFVEELQKIDKELTSPGGPGLDIDLGHEDPILADLNIASEEDLTQMRIDTLTDRYQREFALLDFWKQQEIKKFSDDARAKELIEDLYMKRRVEIAKEEMLRKNALVNTMLVGYQSFTNNLLRTDLTGAEKRKMILEDMQNYVVSMLARELQEYILTKIAELTIHTEAEAAKTAITEAGVAARIVSLVAEIGETLASAAASIVSAAAKFIEWQIGVFGPFALVTIPGSLAAMYGIFEGFKSMLGFAHGGFAVIGENEPEIIAPVTEYAQGQAALVRAAVTAVHHELAGQSLSTSSAGVERKIDELNRVIEKLADRPAWLTDEAVGRIYSRGKEISDGGSL